MAVWGRESADGHAHVEGRGENQEEGEIADRRWFPMVAEDREGF
jgi:hypothetical protein